MILWKPLRSNLLTWSQKISPSFLKFRTHEFCSRRITDLIWGFSRPKFLRELRSSGITKQMYHFDVICQIDLRSCKTRLWPFSSHRQSNCNRKQTYYFQFSSDLYLNKRDEFDKGKFVVVMNLGKLKKISSSVYVPDIFMSFLWSRQTWKPSWELKVYLLVVFEKQEK